MHRRQMGDGDSRIIIYGYIPSLALEIVAIVLFAIALSLHAYKLYRHRAWYFFPVIPGLAMEIIGHVCRCLSTTKDPYRVAFFVAQYFTIVVAPVLFSAAIYTVVSVMIQRYGNKYAPLRPKVILWGFITCDIVCTILQIAGAALVGSAYSNEKDPGAYNTILLAGLAAQVFTFAVFIACSLQIFSRLRNSGLALPIRGLSAITLATLAVYLRTCFRLAETAEGLMKNLSSHEVFFGCLEFAPIVVAVYCLALWHPAKWMPSKTALERFQMGRVDQMV